MLVWQHLYDTDLGFWQKMAWNGTQGDNISHYISFYSIHPEPGVLCLSVWLHMYHTSIFQHGFRYQRINLHASHHRRAIIISPLPPSVPLSPSDPLLNPTPSYHHQQGERLSPFLNHLSKPSSPNTNNRLETKYMRIALGGLFHCFPS